MQRFERPRHKTGGFALKDFSLPYLTAKNLLEAYYKACIAQDKGLAYQIANDLVEVVLKLEDIVHEN